MQPNISKGRKLVQLVYIDYLKKGRKVANWGILLETFSLNFFKKKQNTF
jgi:hypothetical protein